MTKSTDLLNVQMPAKIASCIEVVNQRVRELDELQAISRDLQTRFDDLGAERHRLQHERDEIFGALAIAKESPEGDERVQEIEAELQRNSQEQGETQAAQRGLAPRLSKAEQNITLAREELKAAAKDFIREQKDRGDAALVDFFNQGVELLCFLNAVTLLDPSFRLADVVNEHIEGLGDALDRAEWSIPGRIPSFSNSQFLRERLMLGEITYRGAPPKREEPIDSSTERLRALFKEIRTAIAGRGAVVTDQMERLEAEGRAARAQNEQEALQSA